VGKSSKLYRQWSPFAKVMICLSICRLMQVRVRTVQVVLHKATPLELQSNQTPVNRH
jgi:hypothetical protein